jgi:subtilase-type serine protease
MNGKICRQMGKCRVPSAALAAVGLVFASGAAEAACGSGGTISANSSTCQTLSGGGSLTVEAGVTLSTTSTTTSTDVVTVNSETTGVTITNDGTIASATSGGKGTISILKSAQDLTIDNEADGLITSSGEDAIHAGNVSSGSISVVNYGTISTTGTTSSTNGQAIDFDSTSGTVTISITNYGTITAADSDAIRPGANATIYNYGVISGNSVNGDTGNDGIDFQSQANGTVYNYEGASITGARHGITGSDAITVYNSGTITGELGSGINIDSTSGTTYITNYSTGVITGNAGGTSDGDGIDVDYLAVIKNYGQIYAYGTATGQLSEAVTIGGGEIDNYAGGLIYSVQRAITVDDSNDGNAYGAVTIYNAGTITGADGEAIKITSTYDNTITNDGTINGSITITSADGTTAGDNIITNTGTINGDVTTGSGNDTFNLYTGSTITGEIDGGAGTDTINLEGTGAGSLSNVIDVENLNIDGGTWTLASGLSFSGDVTVASNAAFNVGGGTGTLTIGGNFSQASGAIYDVDVTPGSNTSGTITITGTATIASGAILNVSKTTSASYTIGSSYTVLTATDGVTGTYTLSGDTTVSAFYDLVAEYSDTSVVLDVAQTSSFATAAVSQNQSATANGLQSLAEGNTLRDAVGYLTTFAEARSAFNLLSGEAHASIKSALADDSRFARSAVLDRLRTDDRCSAEWLPVPTLCSSGYSAWARSFGSWGNIDGNGNAHSLDHSTGGFFTGVDRSFNNIRIGALSGYSHSTYNAAEVASSGSSENFHIGLYGSDSWGALSLRVGGTYTLSEISFMRDAAFTGFSERLLATYPAFTGQAFGEVGYRLHPLNTAAGTFALEPFTGLAWVNVHADSFSESGGSAALSASSGNDMNVGYSTLGLHVSHEFAPGGIGLTAKGSFGWQHAFGDVNPTSTFAFSGGDTFTGAGTPVSRNAAIIDAGLSSDVSSNLTIDVSYVGQIGGRSNDQGLRGSAVLRF